MSALKPDVDGTHDLGTTALRWRALHVDSITTATTAQGGTDCTVGTNLVVTGNLTVNGDTTTLSTTNLVVEDKTITLANGAADSAAADGAGISVDGASASFLYDHTGTQWELNKPLEIAGNVLPQADATHDLGSTSLGWNDLHIGSGGVINFNNGDVTATHSANLLAIAGGNTRVDRLEIDSASDFIDVDTDLKLVSGADILLDPTGGDVKVDGNLLPNADNGGALGASGTEWSDLFLHSGGVINFEAGDVTLTHSSNLLSIEGGSTRVSKLEIDSANDHIDVSTDLTLTANADIALVPGGGDVAVTGNVVPSADDGGTLGSANLNWSDLFLADGAVINLGDDQDVTLTHVHETGLLLGGASEFQFRDSGLKIHSTANGQLDIDSDGEVEISAATNLDLDAADVQIDASATFSIQGADDSDITVSAATKDLNLVVSGGGAQVLSLASAGTGTDAIDITASAGGIDIDANGALALDGAGGINIGTATDVAINVDSSTLDFDASGAITIDGTSTISIGGNAAAGNITIGTNATERDITVGNVTGATALKLDAGSGGILIGDAADAPVDIDATTFALDTSSTLSLDSADTANLTMTANAAGNKVLTVAAANSGDGEGHLSLTSDSQVTVTDGTATVLLDGGAATIDTSGVVELNSSGGVISIGNDNVNQAINVGTAGARTLTVGSDNATKVDMNAATIEADAGTKILLDSAGTGSDAIDINSAGGLDVDVADAISLTTTSEDGHIELVTAHTAGVAFHIDANANASSEVQIDAGILDIDVTGAADIDAGGALSLQGGAGSDFTTGAGALTLDGAGGVNIVGNAAEVDITTTGALDINSGAATVDASTLSIDSTDTTNLTMTANDNGEKVLTIDAANSGAGAAKIVLGSTNGTAVQIGHSTSEVTIGDNLTVAGNLVVSGTQTVVDTVTMQAQNAVVFEGATADDFESTLTIIDPTADRTIKLPNQSGCLPVLAADSDVAITATPAELNFVDVTAGTATASKALVLDGSKNIATIGTIGCGAITSSGNSGFAQITTSGRVIVDDATEATSTTDGSLQTDGGLSVAKSAVIGDDLDLLSDAAVLSFGANQDVSLTHVHDTGLLLNGASELQFRDSAVKIKSDADGHLHMEADNTVNLVVNGTDELSITAATATFGTNIVVPNDATIGSAGDADAIAINSSGDIVLSSTTASSSPTTGALKVGGGLGVAGALNVAGATELDGTLKVVLQDFLVANAAGSVERFKVAGGSGNTEIAGTLEVDGNCTLGNAASDLHTVNGGLTVTGVSTTSNITSGGARNMDGSEYVYLVTADDVTVTLPDIGGAEAATGQRFIIKRTAAHTSGVTVSRAGTDLIDGGTSVTLAGPSSGVKAFIEIISDGTNYHIITSGGSVTVN